MPLPRPFQPIADLLGRWLQDSPFSGRAEVREALNALRERDGRPPLSTSAVDHWFAGRKCPRARHILDLAEVLGRSEDDLQGLLRLAAELDGSPPTPEEAAADAA